jgi:S-adenosylmethionine hydrolase
MVLKGEIVHIDSFGNAWTNIPKSSLMEIGALASPELLEVEVKGRRIRGLSAAYHPVAGVPVAVLNSFNLIEIAWPDGSASEKLGLSRGTPVQATISD